MMQMRVLHHNSIQISNYFVMNWECCKWSLHILFVLVTLYWDIWEKITLHPRDASIFILTYREADNF